jgi:hypothetical protein
VREKISFPYKTTGKMINPIFTILKSRLEDRRLFMATTRITGLILISFYL